MASSGRAVVFHNKPIPIFFTLFRFGCDMFFFPVVLVPQVGLMYIIRPATSPYWCDGDETFPTGIWCHNTQTGTCRSPCLMVSHLSAVTVCPRHSVPAGMIAFWGCYQSLVPRWCWSCSFQSLLPGGRRRRI